MKSRKIASWIKNGYVAIQIRSTSSSCFVYKIRVFYRESIKFNENSVMGNAATTIQTKSANLKQAICWISETLEENPEKKRLSVLREAELRFDLTPAECQFLDKNFSESATDLHC